MQSVYGLHLTQIQIMQLPHIRDIRYQPVALSDFENNTTNIHMYITNVIYNNNYFYYFICLFVLYY